MVHTMSKLRDDHELAVAIRKRISRPHTGNNDQEFTNLIYAWESYKAKKLMSKIKDYVHMRHLENPVKVSTSHSVAIKAVFELIKE